MAFLPANLPDVTITTLPALKLNKQTLTFFPFNGYKYQILYQIAHLLQQYQQLNIKHTAGMRFTKSERNLHQPNYNPPCNVYQPTHLLNSNKILTGSLAAPALLSRNTFGYEARFEKDRNLGPGPGSYYDQEKAKMEEKAGFQSVRNKMIKGKHFMHFGTPPSIPYNYYGQNSDEEQKRYMEELLLSENVSEAAKTIKKKDPAFSFGKGQRTHSYIPKPANNEPEAQVNEYEGQQALAYDEQALDSNKKTKLVWQEKIKRANERRMQVIQSIDPQFIPSLELIELIKKKTNKVCPGPGQYHPNEGLHPQFQFYENPKGVSFTTVKRFNSERESVLGPGLYNPKPVENIKKYSFGKSSRTVFQEKDGTNFRFYINPDQETQNSSTKQRERTSSCPFGTRSTRFPQKVTEGPTLTLEQQIKRKQNDRINKMIKAKLKIKQRKTQNEKEEGLLGISTMASTID